MRWLRQDEGFTSLKANGFPAPALWAKEKKKKGKKRLKKRDLNNFFHLIGVTCPSVLGLEWGVCAGDLDVRSVAQVFSGFFPKSFWEFGGFLKTSFL